MARNRCARKVLYLVNNLLRRVNAARPYPFLQFRQATRAEARRLQVPLAISLVPFLSGCCFGAGEGGGPGIRWADVYRVGSLASTPTFCSPSMVMVELRCSGVAVDGATSLVNKDHPQLWQRLVRLLRRWRPVCVFSGEDGGSCVSFGGISLRSVGLYLL